MIEPPVIGWFGKLPSNGDFLRRRVDDAFVSTWDAWLHECLASSREQLGNRWHPIYMTSPVWRFFLCAGLIGSAPVIGMMVPSVDRVGRQFPLTVATRLNREVSPSQATIIGRDWLERIQTLMSHAVGAPELTTDQFDAAVCLSVEHLAGFSTYRDQSLRCNVPSDFTQWRVPLVSLDCVVPSLTAPLMALAQRTLDPLSLWWTEGSDCVQSTCLMTQSLPTPQRFTAMLDGSWKPSGWVGQLENSVAAQAEKHFVLDSQSAPTWSPS